MPNSTLLIMSINEIKLYYFLVDAIMKKIKFGLLRIYYIVQRISDILERYFLLIAKILPFY